MNCINVRDLFSEHLDRPVAEVERHLAVCRECAHELDRLKATVALLRSLEPATPPADFGGRVHLAIHRRAGRSRAPLLRWLAPSLAAAALVAALGVIRSLGPEPSPPPLAQAWRAPAAAPPPAEVVPAAKQSKPALPVPGAAAAPSKQKLEERPAIRIPSDNRLAAIPAAPPPRQPEAVREKGSSSALPGPAGAPGPASLSAAEEKEDRIPETGAAARDRLGAERPGGGIPPNVAQAAPGAMAGAPAVSPSKAGVGKLERDRLDYNRRGSGVGYGGDYGLHPPSQPPPLLPAVSLEASAAPAVPRPAVSLVISARAMVQSVTLRAGGQVIWSGSVAPGMPVTVQLPGLVSGLLKLALDAPGLSRRYDLFIPQPPNAVPPPRSPLWTIAQQAGVAILAPAGLSDRAAPVPKPMPVEEALTKSLANTKTRLLRRGAALNLMPLPVAGEPVR